MPETTTADLFFEAEMAQHPGKSGFYLLASGESAFRTRIAMTRIAEKTIDAQHFIWKADATCALLAQQLMLAADRGVRVRLLLDARLGEIVAQTRHEILLEAAYYIPRNRGIQRLRSVRDRGVRVRVLTNSMATNDMAPAYAGYRRYRMALLENDVELYEL